MHCQPFNYDEIYGLDINDYCEAIGFTIDQLIKKNEKEIEILKEKLKKLVWCEEDTIDPNKTMELINCRYELLQKKERHLERLKKWKKAQEAKNKKRIAS